METGKAKTRREKEGFFEKFFKGKGLDIGAGSDPVTADALTYDLYQGADFKGDATFLAEIPDSKFDWVYSSHCLEHLDDPTTALRNWWRVVKPGGHLIVVVPHRDLYERKKELPSKFNLEHKTFWLQDVHEEPCTLGLNQFVRETITDFEMLLLRTCSDGTTNIDRPDEHADGEFSIEVVLKKHADVV